MNCQLDYSGREEAGRLHGLFLWGSEPRYSRSAIVVAYLTLNQHRHVHEHVVHLANARLQFDDVVVARLNVLQRLLGLLRLHDDLRPGHHWSDGRADGRRGGRTHAHMHGQHWSDACTTGSYTHVCMHARSHHRFTSIRTHARTHSYHWPQAHTLARTHTRARARALARTLPRTLILSSASFLPSSSLKDKVFSHTANTTFCVGIRSQAHSRGRK